MREQATTFIDPNELARLDNLSLIATTGVLGFVNGLHRSLHTGSSAEFAHYRPYSQGDDPRFVDWRVYGRSDRLNVKEYQNESNMRCTILLDCSASMDYGSGGLTKFRYSQMLAACLVLLLSRQHDSIGFIGYHDQINVQIPARSHPNHARRILVELQNLKASGQTNTAGVLNYLGDVLPPRGMIIVISDLLQPIDDVINHLRSLRARRHDILVLQIADPAEQTFPFEKAVTLLGLEEGREQFASPEDVRDIYLDNRAKHFGMIRSECLAAEIEIEEFATNEPLDRALHQFVNRRNNALVTASRRRGHHARGGH